MTSFMPVHYGIFQNIYAMGNTMNFAQWIKYGPFVCKDGLRKTDKRLNVQYEAFEVRSMHGKFFLSSVLEVVFRAYF